MAQQIRRTTPPSLRRRVSAFINHPTTDLLIMVLIIISVGLIIWEVSLDKGTLLKQDLNLANDLITYLFIIELSLRFYAERRKRRFFRRFWIDILAVLPIFRSLRFLRFLRLLRVFRLGVLLNRRFAAISAAFRKGFGEQVIVFGIILVIILAAAMVLTITEKEHSPLKSFSHALRWSVLSLVAGEPIEETPRSVCGVVVTLSVMLGGLTLFATFTGVITAIVVNRLKGGLEQFEMDLGELNGHTILCGFNRACRLIVEELQTDIPLRRRGIVLVAETDIRQEMEGGHVDLARVFFIQGDWTHPKVLTRCGAERAAIAVVLSDRTRELSDQDRDARTLLAALTLERINPSIFTCAELLNSQNEANLKLAGIDEVIARDKYTGSIIAAGARSLGIVGVLRELLTSKWGNQFFKIEVPEEWTGRPLTEVRDILMDTHHAILVALETPVEGKHTGVTVVNPDLAMVLQPGQILVLIAKEEPRIGKTSARGLWSSPGDDTLENAGG